MTKQDNKKPLRAIMIGGGFRVNTPHQTYGYPKNRLSNFLNFKFDKDKEEDFFEFCSNHQLIFFAPSRDQTFDLFLNEQKMLRTVAEKLARDELSQGDLDLINKKLGEVKIQVTYPAKDDQSLMNTPIPFKQKFKSNHLITFKKYPNSVISLWEDLVKRFIENQDIKECANCGDFFILESRHKRRYCDKPQCKNTYNKRASRLKNKAQS